MTSQRRFALAFLLASTLSAFSTWAVCFAAFFSALLSFLSFVFASASLFNFWSFKRFKCVASLRALSSCTCCWTSRTFSEPAYTFLTLSPPHGHGHMAVYTRTGFRERAFGK